MKTTPVACSLRVAAYPLKGATPAARQSRFRGVSGSRHFAPELLWEAVSPCAMGAAAVGVLRVNAFARRQSMVMPPPGRLM
jgi:hypothetical protein